jgi:DDE superfamily endonuclease
VTQNLGRTALCKGIFTSLQPRRLGELVAGLAGAWMAAEESRLRERRGHDRMHAPGAGPARELPFTDRVIVTLVVLRFQLPHAALAELYRVDRSTVTRAVREVRPLLAARGFAVPGEPGLRLRTLADVFAYASARGVELRPGGTEVQVRRPKAGRPGRRAFVSGKKKMNTKKAAVVTDEKGRTLWAGAFRPGCMHDQTTVRTAGIADLFRQFPEVKAKVDAGYRGLAKEFPRPGPGTAAQAEEGRDAGGSRRLGRGAPPAVLGTDLRRARQRRAQAVAQPPAVPRTTRKLRRNLPGRGRPGLRPRRRKVITNQPARQASTPRR